MLHIAGPKYSRDALEPKGFIQACGIMDWRIAVSQCFKETSMSRRRRCAQYC